MSPVFWATLSFFFVFGASNAVVVAMNARARKNERRLLNRLSERDVPVLAPAPSVLIDVQAGRRTPFERLVVALQAKTGIGKLLERAGNATDPAVITRRCLLGGLCTTLPLMLLLHGPARLACLLAFASGGFSPLWWIARKSKKRLARFEGQFPDGLEFIARSMRAGHAFSVSLEMLYQEFDEPMAGEFRRTFEEQNLGLPLEVALAKFAERVPLVDVRFFTSAVLLQRKTGGNLTEILDKLAHLIRERYKLRGKIRAVSAHGRMTGKALSAIPIFVCVLMFFLNRSYAAFFMETTIGNQMLLGCVVLQAIGYMVIQKIVNIEV